VFIGLSLRNFYLKKFKTSKHSLSFEEKFLVAVLKIEFYMAREKIGKTIFKCKNFSDVEQKTFVWWSQT